MTLVELETELAAALADRAHVPADRAEQVRREMGRLFIAEGPQAGPAAAARYLRLTLPTLGLPRRFVSDRSRAIPNSPLVRPGS